MTSSELASGSHLEKQQSKLRKTVLGELQFMLHHFKQMLKSYEKGNSSVMIAGNHSRLSSFIPHLQQTIDQLHEPLASEEALATLERHLEKTLLPVKRRLEAQLKQSLPPAASTRPGDEDDDDEHSDDDDDDDAERIKKRKKEEAEALGCISEFFGDVAIVEDPAIKRRRHRGQRQLYQDNVVTSEGSSSGTASDSSDSNSFSHRETKMRLPSGLGGNISSHSAPQQPAQTRSAPTIASSSSEGGGSSRQTVSSKPAPLRRRASTQVLPERVEYHCACCGETYIARSSTIYNPWWSLVRQACPKCDQSQFPWIDISSATNQITHRPALPDVADGGGNPQRQQRQGDFQGGEGMDEDDQGSEAKPGVDVEMDSDDDDAVIGTGDEEDDEQQAFLLLAEKDHLLPGAVDEDTDELDVEDAIPPDLLSPPLPPSDNEDFKFADEEDEAAASDRLSKRQASRLLKLFHHARNCPGHHRSPRHASLCASTKYVMLHARDCRGTLPCGSPCPFEWCGPVKRLLGHVVRCSDHSICEVCAADARRDVHKSFAAACPTKQYEKPIPRIVIRKKDERRSNVVVIKRDSTASSSQPPPYASKRDRRFQRPSFDYWESLINVIETPEEDADDDDGDMMTGPRAIVG